MRIISSFQKKARSTRHIFTSAVSAPLRCGLAMALGMLLQSSAMVEFLHVDIVTSAMNALVTIASDEDEVNFFSSSSFFSSSFFNFFFFFVVL